MVIVAQMQPPNAITAHSLVADRKSWFDQLQERDCLIHVRDSDICVFKIGHEILHI
jgi:hypothetical protein